VTGGLGGAPLSAVAAARLAAVEADVVASEHAYQAGRRSAAYWAMTDLRGSAAWRVLAGDRSAYVRAEVFSRAARELLQAHEGVEVLKELGDAVLCRSDGLRPLLEVACLLDMVGRGWATGRDGGGPTLGARTAVTYGTAVRLERGDAHDYVGAALDRLARVSGVPQDGDVVLVIDDDAYNQDRDLLMEYPYLRADGPSLLPARLRKAGEPAVRTWAVSTDRGAMADSRDNFVPYRRG
jgi:hypothetical protein